MPDSRTKIASRLLARQGLAAQAAFLAGIVALVALPLTLGAYAISGAPGVIAALAAGLVCWMGGAVALVAAGQLKGRFGALHAVLGGMFARLAFPLGLGIGLHLARPELTDAGMFFYFLVFYPVVLAAETLLAVAHLGQDPSAKRAV
jgi:hypothetical protein